jgi:hypothetical protein
MRKGNVCGSHCLFDIKVLFRQRYGKKLWDAKIWQGMQSTFVRVGVLIGDIVGYLK